MRAAKPRLVTSTATRFRQEFKPAFNAWIATKPLKTKGAPLTPFAMPQYRLAARAEAERLDQTAEVLSAAGATEHPALVQLRPRRRPLRGRALLRGDEHEAHCRPVYGRRCWWSAASSSWAPSSGSRRSRSASRSSRAAEVSSLQESASLKAASSSPPASSCLSSVKVEESWLAHRRKGRADGGDSRDDAARARGVVDGALSIVDRFSSSVVGELVERLLRLLAGVGVGRPEASHVVDEVARCALDVVGGAPQRSPRSGSRPSASRPWT